MAAKSTKKDQLLAMLYAERALAAEQEQSVRGPSWFDRHERLTVYLPKGLMSQIRECAKTKNMSPSQFVANVMSDVVADKALTATNRGKRSKG